MNTRSKSKKKHRKSSKSLSKKTIVQKENQGAINAIAAHKRKQSQHNQSKAGPSKNKSQATIDKNEKPETLAQRLLLDITEKYKNLSVAQHSCYINKLEKKTMIHEINTLANALIKNEKKYVKL